MKTKIPRLLTCSLLVLSTTTALLRAQSAPSLNVLYDFTGSPDGANPQAALVQGNDGNFYGTTINGGSSDKGAIFKMTPAGSSSILVSFNGANGAAPMAALVQDKTSPYFYGTTYGGGSSNLGTVFEMDPSNQLIPVHFFGGADGANPAAGLVQAIDGNFYGTTRNGGGNGQGTIFKMNHAGALTTLVSFNGANGANPAAALVQDSYQNEYNFYGTTLYGGSNNLGTVFKMTQTGVLTTLVSFDDTNGAWPQAALVQGNDGTLYGTTGSGGGGEGTVFKVTPDGVLTTLMVFNSTNGSAPLAALIQGSDGYLYSTTHDGGSDFGTIFRITPAGAFTSLVSFDGLNGGLPEAALVQGSDGNLYGTTYSSGTSDQGTIFKLLMPPSTGAPVFAPNPPCTTYATAVDISTSTPGATIRYTTDGSAPSETNGAIYSGALSVSTTTTIRAIAYKDGIDSFVTGGVLTITPPQPE